MKFPPLKRIASFTGDLARQLVQFEQNVREQFEAFAGRLGGIFLFPSEWAPFTPTFRVFGDPTAVIGNGELRGRYRQTGDTVEAEIYVGWGSTTTLGVLATPNLLLSLPPGKTPDYQKLIKPTGFTASVFQVLMAGTIGGTVSQGAVYQGLAVFFSGDLLLMGIPAGIKSAFVNGDSVLIRYTMPVTQGTGV